MGDLQTPCFPPSLGKSAKPLQPGPSKVSELVTCLHRGRLSLERLAPYLPDEHSAHIPVIPAEGREHLHVPWVPTTAIARARA